MEKKIDRRGFIRTSGLAALGMAGCGSLIGAHGAAKGDAEKPADAEGMTYRTNLRNGDKVSILGYGCMRWPMTKDENGKDIIDQETTNRLVDYALEHGVNYFDTAPMYIQAMSETATGIALKRHPRESYFIATKLSNHGNPTWEKSLEMYRRSFERLQTDYIDYYLLHNVGSGKKFKERFLDNGVLDFLVEERKAGRIRNLGFSFHGQKEGFDEILAYHDKYHFDFVQIQLNYLDWKHADGWNCNADYLQGELDKRGFLQSSWSRCSEDALRKCLST